MKKIVLLFVLTLALWSCQQEKTAFVDNTKIMEEFEVLKTTEEKYALEEESMKAKMDAMVAQSGYQELVSKYQANQGKMSKTEEEKLYAEIMQIQQTLGQQQQMNTQMFQQQKNTEMDSLVTLVKDFISDYGKSNSYAYIYGKNESGNIIYGKEELDITEKVISALNDKYGEEKAAEETEDVKEDSTESTEVED